MSTPTGDNAFLHELELDVRAELTQAEASQPEEEAIGVPIDEWLSDPADDQRYEASLRSLLGAVEALEDGSGSRGRGSSAEVPGTGETLPLCRMAGTGTPRPKAGEPCRSHGST